MRGDPLRRPDRADELALPALRCRPDDLDRIAVRRHADDAPLVALEDCDELRQFLRFGEALLRDDDREVGRQFAAAARVARRLAAERRRQLADEGERSVQGHPAPRPCAAELREPRVDPCRRLRPDSWDAVEPSLRRNVAQLRQRPDPERMPELTHPLCGHAEQRSHADQLWQRLRLELVQLGDAAGLDELAEPGLDAGADTGKLPHPSLAHERGHIGGRRADQVGRAAVRAHGVEAGAVEVQEGSEGVEAIGEGSIVHD